MFSFKGRRIKASYYETNTGWVWRGEGQSAGWCLDVRDDDLATCRIKFITRLEMYYLEHHDMVVGIEPEIGHSTFASRVDGSGTDHFRIYSSKSVISLWERFWKYWNVMALIVFLTLSIILLVGLGLPVAIDRVTDKKVEQILEERDCAG